MGARLHLAFAVALVAQAANAQPVKAPKPPPRLFASDQPIRFALRGPIQAIASSGATSTAARPARLILTMPAAEEHPVMLSARGIARTHRVPRDRLFLRYVRRHACLRSRSMAAPR